MIIHLTCYLRLLFLWSNCFLVCSLLVHSRVARHSVSVYVCEWLCFLYLSCPVRSIRMFPLLFLLFAFLFLLFGYSLLRLFLFGFSLGLFEAILL